MTEPNKFYQNSSQRQLVFDGVSALLDLTKRKGQLISKETLNLIFDRYCYIVDPPQGLGEDKRYNESA